jgi:predicted dehydrogenase
VNPVRTAIVGLGYFGPNVLRNFAAQAECEMVYACDLDDARLQDTARKYPAVRTTKRYEDVLEDASIELVLIATPTSTHFDLARKALEAGKHVFIEKPFTQTPEEADTLVALAEQQKRLIFVDHTFVFAPAVQRLGEMAASGKLGDLLYFESSRINLGLIQRDTNALFDLAIHDLSILHSILDLRGIQTVCAHGSKHFGQQEEQVHLHLTYGSGVTAHIHVSWLSPVKIRQTILGGTKAMAMYDDTHPSEKLRIYDRGIEHDTSKADPFFPKYRSGDVLIPALSNEETLAIEAKHVLRCVQGQEQPLVSGADGADIVRVLHTADRSLKLNGATLPFVCPSPSTPSLRTSSSEQTLSSAIS